MLQCKVAALRRQQAAAATAAAAHGDGGGGGDGPADGYDAGGVGGAADECSSQRLGVAAAASRDRALARLGLGVVEELPRQLLVHTVQVCVCVCCVVCHVWVVPCGCVHRLAVRASARACAARRVCVCVCVCVCVRGVHVVRDTRQPRTRRERDRPAGACRARPLQDMCVALQLRDVAALVPSLRKVAAVAAALPALQAFVEQVRRGVCVRVFFWGGCRA
jgi:hypothetical protein